jgi:hypothetical protein
MTTTLALPTLLIIASAAIFMTLERLRPGRKLPNAPSWYMRALVVTGFQIAITLGTNSLWSNLFGSASLFNLDADRGNSCPKMR